MNLRLAALTVAFAFSAHGGVAMERSPYEDLCRASALRFSPEGRFVYASSAGALVYAEVDCLVSGRPDCAVRRAVSPAAFPRSVHVGPGQKAYFLAAGVSAEGRATGDNELREFDLRTGLFTPPRPFLKTQRDLLGYVAVEPGPASSGATDPGAQARTARVLDAAALEVSSLAVNVRNVYGRVAGERSIQLHRRDSDYSVWYRLDGGAERFLWANGNPFSQRRSNLEFRFDGPDAVALVSGGVVRIPAKGGLVDETAGKSRAVLINGDDPALYYGFWSAEGLQARRVDPGLARGIEQVLNQHPRDHVSGLALNNGAASLLVSFGPFRDAQGGALNRHVLRRGGQSMDIDCGGARLADHQVRRIGGGNGLFVDRYIVDPKRVTVLYLTGGSGQHVNLEDRFDNDVARLLDSGFNVDVVQYGGSDYTFAQANRLYREGARSIRRDAGLISDYVRKTYAADQKVSLYAFSFGAYFARRLPRDLMTRFEGVVLAAPAGVMNDPDYGQVRDEKTREAIAALSVKANDLLWGADTRRGEREYFKGLKQCPALARMTVVVGAADEVVSPASDYGVCRDDPRVGFLGHPYGHISPLDPRYAEKLEVDDRVLSILAGPAASGRR